MAVPKEYSLLRAACIYLELYADIFSANVAGTCSEVTIVTEPRKCPIYLRVHLNVFHATISGDFFRDYIRYGGFPVSTQHHRIYCQCIIHYMKVVMTAPVSSQHRARLPLSFTNQSP